MTRTKVRSVDQMGPGDVAVGQEWYKSLAQAGESGRWTVVRVTESRVYLECYRGGRRLTCDADFGSFLTRWVLTAEAGE